MTELRLVTLRQLLRADSTCGECLFWEKGDPYGECRRNPPIPEGVNWPVTGFFDWCGEFVHKQELKDGK